MSKTEVKKVQERKSVCSGPFGTYINADKQIGFDKFYKQGEEKIVFKSTGQKDEEGNDLGTQVIKHIIKKIDIAELINSQADMVGVESYLKALMAQGIDPSTLSTTVSDDIQDFSELPSTLADVMTAGDKAKAAFEKLDPALKRGHTTIEGFLNALTSEQVDAYIKGRIEALTPKKAETEVKGE